MHATVARVAENERDVGLRRALGPIALAGAAVSEIVGAGIFVVPAAVAASVGSYGPLAFFACALAMGAVAVCFAEGGSRVPTSGGAYGFIEAAFGPLPAYITGSLLLIGCVLACGGVAVAFAELVAALAPQPLMSEVRTLVIIAVIGAIALINMGGVERGARLVSIATAVKLVPLVIFVLAGVGAIHSANFSRAAPSAAGLGRAMILCVFSFVGMETALCVSGEVARPNRTIPRALAIALGSTAVLYVAIQTVAQGLLGAALPNSKAPLADAMAQVHPALRAVMLAGGALSMLGYLVGDILGSPRQLFALARDGLLPRVLGRVHPRTHVPHIAILCYAALSAILALTGSFAELAALSTLAITPLYIVGCAAAWLLARRDVALAGPPLRFRFLGIAVVVGMVSMSLLIGMGSREEILGLLGLIALSTVVYLLQTRVIPVRQ
jgi:basic amino acid/polyamine antiporter, APA family